MVKKISFFLAAAAILACGYFGFRKLNYWERSVRIFTMSKSDQFFEGRGGRGHGGFEDRGDFDGNSRFVRPEGSREVFERPDIRDLPDSLRTKLRAEGRGQGLRGRNIPDSMRVRFENEGGRPVTRDRNIPDSLRQQFGRVDGERLESIPFERGIRNGEGRGRREFAGGKKVNLRTVSWFLAVFAAFTVIVIYIDRAYCLIRKNQRRSR